MKEFVYKPNIVLACQYKKENLEEIISFIKELFKDRDVQVVQIGNGLILESSCFKRLEVKETQWCVVMKDLSSIVVVEDTEFYQIFQEVKMIIDTEPIAGNKYLCIRDVVMKDGDHLYFKDHIYYSEEDGYITNENLDRLHRWDNEDDGNGYTFKNTFQLLGHKDEIIGVASGPSTTDNIKVDQDTPPA